MAPRCQICKHHREVWNPQPGVNWDRCAVNNMESCGGHNANRDCAKFEALFIPSTLDKIFGHQITPLEEKWWAPYY